MGMRMLSKYQSSSRMLRLCPYVTFSLFSPSSTIVPYDAFKIEYPLPTNKCEPYNFTLKLHKKFKKKLKI